MAFRYLIYSTGTTYATTIVRESATNNPGVNEASLYTDFVIPEIQPLYLWRVTGGVNVVPNTDANISAYEEAIAPAPTPDDLVTYGELTGATESKIDKVSGATDNIAIFDASGNVINSGYTIPELTGLTTYTFIGSGGTQVFENGNQITIYSTMPTGATVSWGNITGNLSAQTDLWADLVYLSGQTSGLTATKLDISTFNAYTGATQPIIDAALTGVTNLGTGTTLGSVLNRNIELKSISVLGGLSILGDANNLIISGGTGGMSSVAWGQITGTLSGQTDLWNVLTGQSAQIATKLDITTFNSYTGATENRLDALEAWTGVTDSRLDAIEIWTGTTESRLDALDIWTGTTEGRLDALEAWTGTTAPIIAAALTGATNGLTKSGRDVELGGALTKDTVISGTSFDFTVNTDNITLQSTGAIQLIDANGVGGISLESDGGTISIIGNDSVGIEKTKLEINDTQMLITDSRATQVGLQYAADYSTTFTNESLITKRYADAIAAGLVPKEAVLVATTGAITLSGLTTIDGIALANGDRVLVKNQANAINNGIYVASASTWSRATDFDDLPSVEVTSGNIIPVISGNSNHNTLWVLITPNPVQVGTDPLNFTLFASPMSYVAGIGIDISGNTISVDGASLAGSSIVWSGNTFNVDPTTGNLATALSQKLNVNTFNSYTGATQPIIDGALTGATNGLTKVGRNAELGGNLSGNVTINGLNQHDLFIANIDEFQVATDGITGATFGVDTQGISLIFSGTSVSLESNAGLEYGADYSANYSPRSLVDKGYVTGLTSGLQSQINYISGVTDTKLDTDVFTGYTATTKNKDKKIQLVSTGTTNVNTVAATPIIWHSANPYATDIYSYTGGSSGIKILLAGTYEVQYHITLKNDGANQTHSNGGYLILNNLSTIPITATAAMVIGPNNSGELSLPPVVLTLSANDELDLAAFRIGNAGTVNTVSGSVYLVLNKLS